MVNGIFGIFFLSLEMQLITMAEPHCALPPDFFLQKIFRFDTVNYTKIFEMDLTIITRLQMKLWPCFFYLINI